MDAETIWFIQKLNKHTNIKIDVSTKSLLSPDYITLIGPLALLNLQSYDPFAVLVAKMYQGVYISVRSVWSFLHFLEEAVKNWIFVLPPK